METVFKKVKRIGIDGFKGYLNEKYKVDQLGYPYAIRIEKPLILPGVHRNFFALQNVEGGKRYVVSG